MYHFKEKTIGGLPYDIFTERDGQFYGRVQFSLGQWDAVAWGKNGVALGSAEKIYDLVIDKYHNSSKYLEDNCIENIETLTYEYLNASDEIKEKIKEKIDRHNQRVKKENNYYKTVKDLKEKLKDVPEHYLVCYQRVTDSCFSPKSGWTENNFILPFNFADDWDNYLKVFNALARDQEEVFVLEAHY